MGDSCNELLDLDAEGKGDIDMRVDGFTEDLHTHLYLIDT
jgi:hypothetical protein